MVSQAYGARRIADCHGSLWSALYLCVALVPILMIANAAMAQSVHLK
jgi:Na+-driven multidrug efflux pump